MYRQTHVQTISSRGAHIHTGMCVLCVYANDTPYRKSNSLHKFGRAFLPVCNRDIHITKGRIEILLIAYHITFGAKWMLHYSGLRDPFPKHPVRWMHWNPFIGSKCCPLFAFSLLCHCHREGYFWCTMLFAGQFLSQKRINFFLPFSIFISNF